MKLHKGPGAFGVCTETRDPYEDSSDIVDAQAGNEPQAEAPFADAGTPDDHPATPATCAAEVTGLQATQVAADELARRAASRAAASIAAMYKRVGVEPLEPAHTYNDPACPT
jgi:hypothetical protein